MFETTVNVRCPAIDLVEIRRCFKISWWIWTKISGVVNVLGCPERGTKQVKKSPHLNWDIQSLTVAYDGEMFPWSFFQKHVNFLRRFDLLKKNSCWQLASRCCWNGACRLTCFLSASVTRKDLQFGTWTNPSFRHHRISPTKFGSRYV